MIGTREQLLTEARTLVRRRGYGDFSYADLASAVGIRKASIHHHFPTKGDLGEALVEDYAERFERELAAIWNAGTDAQQKLDDYAELYREGLRHGEACLCGMLATEVAILPVRVKEGVARFFEGNLVWLARVIADGQARGAFEPGIDPERQAKSLFATLQGGMFVARAAGDPSLFHEAFAGALQGLRPKR